MGRMLPGAPNIGNDPISRDQDAEPAFNGPGDESCLNRFERQRDILISIYKRYHSSTHRQLDCLNGVIFQNITIAVGVPQKGAGKIRFQSFRVLSDTSLDIPFFFAALSIGG